MNSEIIFPVLVFVGLETTVLPIWRILKKAGLSPYWSLWAIIPLFGHLVVMGKLAFSRWPETE